MANTTNQKIEKVKSDIEKTKSKILTYQTKLRELERDKTRLENEQIVALVRSERISDADLSTLMKSLRKESPKAAPAEPPAAGQETTGQEEPLNENLDEN